MERVAGGEEIGGRGRRGVGEEKGEAFWRGVRGGDVEDCVAVKGRADGREVGVVGEEEGD